MCPNKWTLATMCKHETNEDKVMINSLFQELTKLNMFLNNKGNLLKNGKLLSKCLHYAKQWQWSCQKSSID